MTTFMRVDGSDSKCMKLEIIAREKEKAALRYTKSKLMNREKMTTHEYILIHLESQTSSNPYREINIKFHLKMKISDRIDS